MNWPIGLAHWIGRRRVFASLAGSLVANGVLMALVASSLAASEPAVSSPMRVLTVTLAEVPQLPPPPEIQKVSATSPVPQRTAAPVVGKSRAAEAQSADAAGGDPAEGVAIGPPPAPTSRPPAGLDGLLAADPCESLPAKDRPATCRSGWSDRIAQVPKALARRIEKTVDAELAATVVHPDCGSKHLGCAPIPERTLIGTRPVDRSMSPGGKSGTDSMVGRLPPPNAYHVDPGFGD